MTADIWDVLIVGAGLSGLSAAHLLLKKNPKLRILILEGKDRVGGRTVSYEIPAADGADRWDFGGQWVGRTQRHVLELIKELGLEVYPQFNDGKKVLHVGGPASKVRAYKTSIPALSPLVLLDMSQLLWKIERLRRTVCVQDPSKTPNADELDSMTLSTFLEQNAWTAELKEQIGVSSRSVFGMEPAQMSFLFFLMYAAAAGGLLALLESTPGCAQELKIKGGSQQLSECLAERVGWKNVRLGSAVTAIWQDAEWAKVMTSSDTFLCKAVIITCPPHLAAKISYQPALPSMRGFLTQNMPVGHMMKFIITYQTAFWKEKGFSGEIVAGSSTDCPFCVTFDATSPRGNAALVGFIAGQQASHWSTKEAEQRKSAVISSLVRYLGPEAASFIHYEEKDLSSGSPDATAAVDQGVDRWNRNLRLQRRKQRRFIAEDTLEGREACSRGLGKGGIQWRLPCQCHGARSADVLSSQSEDALWQDLLGRNRDSHTVVWLHEWCSAGWSASSPGSTD